jgi:uncharacterized Zn finger protein (UPF0148 family)
MAASHCLKCGSSIFKSITKFAVGSQHKIKFVQCSVCGEVVSVQEDQGQNVRKNSFRFDQMQESVLSSLRNQAKATSDIESLIKYLYG